jgi:hypothetical protein
VEAEIKSSYEAGPLPLFKIASTSDPPGNVEPRCLDTGGGSMDEKGFGCIDFLKPRTIAAGLDGDVVVGDAGEGLEVGPSLDELSSSSSSSSSSLL